MGDTRRSERLLPGPPPSTSKAPYSWIIVMPLPRNLFILKADLTRRPVDAVVNAANSHLVFKLRAKWIIHAVGPRWRGGKVGIEMVWNQAGKRLSTPLPKKMAK